MAIDFHCNLFTPESIQRNWYDQPEMHGVRLECIQPGKPS